MFFIIESSFRACIGGATIPGALFLLAVDFASFTYVEPPLPFGSFKDLRAYSTALLFAAPPPDRARRCNSYSYSLAVCPPPSSFLLFELFFPIKFATFDTTDLFLSLS